MKGWLAQAGLDRRYLGLWLAFMLPLLLLSVLGPAGSWSGLPLLVLGCYAVLVIVGLPIWALIYQQARRSECSESFAALLASWAAVFLGSIALAGLRQVSEGRFSWQSLVQTSLGFGFYGIVVMSIAVPRLFGVDRDAAAGRSDQPLDNERKGNEAHTK